MAKMAVAAGSRAPALLDPVHCTLKASSSAGSPNRPPLHLREQNSPMKNRKREICTSGSARDEGGNILIYSAAWKRSGVAARGARAAAGAAEAPAMAVAGHNPPPALQKRSQEVGPPAKCNPFP